MTKTTEGLEKEIICKVLRAYVHREKDLELRNTGGYKGTIVWSDYVADFLIKYEGLKDILATHASEVECGNANPNGNVALTFKGGCRKKLAINEAYRCVGCGGWFHKDCILKHFELEKEDDWGRKQERKALAEKVKELSSWKGLLIYKDRVLGMLE